MQFDHQKVTNKIWPLIRQKVDDLCRNGVILGMSGGVDSVLTTTLLTNALEAKKF
jgi:NH3-dependent NAD+ synthetase